MSQDQPGGAVADSEGPAAEDDPLGPTEGTDVLKVRQVGRLLGWRADSPATWAFMGWQIAMYLSTVKADRKSAEAFIARNCE